MFFPSLIHIHSHIDSQTHSHTLTLTHTYTLTLSHTHSLSHSHIHSHTSNHYWSTASLSFAVCAHALHFPALACPFRNFSLSNITSIYVQVVHALQQPVSDSCFVSYTAGQLHNRCPTCSYINLIREDFPSQNQNGGDESSIFSASCILDKIMALWPSQ